MTIDRLASILEQMNINEHEENAGALRVTAGREILSATGVKRK